MDLINFYVNSFKVYFLNKKAIDDIHDNYSWGTALVAGLVLSFIANIFTLLFQPEKSVLGFLYILFYTLVMYPISVFLGVSFIWILLKIFGGKPKYMDLLKFLVSMSITPSIIISLLSIPLYFMVESMGILSMDIFFIYLFIYVIIVMLMMVWMVYLSIVIYSLISNISKLRTFFAMVIIPLGILLLMVFLVVSVAVQTASSFQSKSLDVGRQSQEKITTDIEIVQVYAADTSDGIINGIDTISDKINLIVRLGPGSSPINLNDLTIEMETITMENELTSQTLQYATSVKDVFSYDVTYISNSGVPGTTGYLVTGDLVQISFDNLNTVNQGETITIRLLTKNGAVKPIDMTTPSVMVETTTDLFP